MTAEHRSEEPSVVPVGSQPQSPARRRLFRGAAGGAGVLLAVHARTALGGGTCQSPSGTMSGNQSPRPNSGITCSGGRSPGFWKVPQKFSFWSRAGATPPTFNVEVNECMQGMQNLALSNLLTQGTSLDSIGLSGSAPAGTGIWAVMAFPNSFTGGQLMRHLSAAWLNAGYFTDPTARYPITRQQVIDMWNATKAGGLYCPSSMVGGCPTPGWSASQVIAYISGMYDANAAVESDLCKP